MSIESLLTTKVIEAVKQCYDADVDKDKVQLQATRKEFAGDLTVVVFPFTRFSKKSPEKSKPGRRWPCIFGKGIVKYYQIEAE